MEDLICQLCLTKASLISLYRGKHSMYRELLRKITYDVLDIKLNEKDADACVCINCASLIYNFYIFKTRSIESQKKIMMKRPKCMINKPLKNITPVTDIHLPDMRVLKRYFKSWLQKKIDGVDDEIDEKSENAFAPKNKAATTSRNGVVEENTCVSVNATTQVEISKDDCAIQCTPSVEMKQSQCNIQKDSKSIKTQTLRNSKHRSIQCDLKEIQNCRVVSQHVGIQTEVHQTDQVVQCSLRVELVDKYCQSEQILENNITNCFMEEAQEEFLANTGLLPSRSIPSDSEDITSIVNIRPSPYRMRRHLRFIDQNVQCSISSSVRNASTQNSIETSHVGTQSSFMDVVIQTDECYLTQNGTLKELFVDPKKEVIPPYPESPPLSIVSCKSDPALAIPVILPISSPSTLLTVSKKINRVQICTECDVPLYTKLQARRHNKIHLICKLCNRKFKTVEQTKHHFLNECDTKFKMLAVIPIKRLEIPTGVEKEPVPKKRKIRECKQKPPRDT